MNTLTNGPRANAAQVFDFETTDGSCSRKGLWVIGIIDKDMAVLGVKADGYMLVGVATADAVSASLTNDNLAGTVDLS